MCDPGPPDEPVRRDGADRDGPDRLREREDLLRQTLRHASAGTFEWIIGSGEVRWSPENFALYGIAPAGVLTFERWQQAVHPEDLGRALAAVRAALDGRAPEYRTEFRVRHPTRGTRWIMAVGQVERAPDGRPVRLLGLNLDITDRKRVEVALRESEERFRLLLDHAADAFFLHDPDGRFRDVNLRACETLGYGREELLRLGVTDVEQGFDLAAARAIWVRCEVGDHFTVHGHHRRRDGTVFPVEVRGACVSVRGERLFASLARDVTERVRAEALRERLADAQRLESVGRLAGGVAHDFNNLLTVLLSASEALRDDHAAGRPVQVEDIDEIRVAGRRAADLTRQLLAFARKQVIAPTPLDLNAVVRGAETLVRRAIREDIRLVLDLCPDAWPIRCDRGQLEQVLLNLAANARDAMPEGGTLTLATRNVPGEPPAPGDAAGPGWVALTVRDTGVGLSPEVKAHLFEPFFTTKAPGEGTGLGLATVHGIVHQSGGTIVADGDLGRGSAFELRFPRHDGPVLAPALEAQPAGPRGHETVLVVEDDRPVRDVAVRALRAAGYAVLEARGGPDALELLARSDAAPALLVTDVVMPGLNGRQVAEEVRRRHPGARILFVSGYTQEIIQRHEALEPGVEFLAKPFTPAELLARVRGVLDRPASPAASGDRRPGAEPAAHQA